MEEGKDENQPSFLCDYWFWFSIRQTCFSPPLPSSYFSPWLPGALQTRLKLALPRWEPRMERQSRHWLPRPGSQEHKRTEHFLHGPKSWQSVNPVTKECWHPLQADSVPGTVPCAWPSRPPQSPRSTILFHSYRLGNWGFEKFWNLPPYPSDTSSELWSLLSHYAELSKKSKSLEFWVGGWFSLAS